MQRNKIIKFVGLLGLSLLFLVMANHVLALEISSSIVEEVIYFEIKDSEPFYLGLPGEDTQAVLFIEPTGVPDFSRIDIHTLRLNDTVFSKFHREYRFTQSPEIKDRDGNGIPELMVELDYQKVKSILENQKRTGMAIFGEIFFDETPTRFEAHGMLQPSSKESLLKMSSAKICLVPQDRLAR